MSESTTDPTQVDEAPGADDPETESSTTQKVQDVPPTEASESDPSETPEKVTDSAVVVR